MKEVIKPSFMLGQIVKHKFLRFRGVIFDIDQNLIIPRNGI